jgi:hypothetical protein
MHSLYPQYLIQSTSVLHKDPGGFPNQLSFLQTSADFPITSQKNMDNQYNMEKEEAEVIVEKKTKQEIESFLNSLSEKELKAYAIANSFLRDTFDIDKSNGFTKWKSLNELNKQTIGEKNL